MRRRRLFAGLTLALLVGACAALGWLFRERRPAPGLAARGRVLFAELGCEGCHGPGGLGGVANPGSSEREVPGFAGGTAMMYVEKAEEIREWILDGRPARLQEAHRHADALLEMPAFRERINDEELEALVAYFRAVAWYSPGLSEELARGRRLAQAAGCFGCHGPSGQAGVANPGSFKGYVPGWGSPDYFELVKDDAELRAWIADGIGSRFRGDGIAKQLLDRATLKMPAYRGRLSAEEIDLIAAFVKYAAAQNAKTQEHPAPP